MSDRACSILLLAGHLGVHDDGWSIRPFLDRLEQQGLRAQVLCIEAAGDVEDDPRIIESPGLGTRWRSLFAVRGLRFGERLNRPSLLHVVQSRMCDVGLAIAEHWRIPYILTIDEYIPREARLRLSQKWCRRLVASSRELADDLESHLKIPGRWIETIHPGIEAPEDSSTATIERPVTVIGTAGPLVPASGFPTFLNAARRILDTGVDAEFVIAGQGADEVDLRRRADRLKIADRVTFAGIPVVGLRYWSVLDIFCQTSLIPSVGRSLATALAYGVPSVASDIEGLRALITHQRNGLLFPPGDSVALAKAVMELQLDTGRARRLGREGRSRMIRDFHPEAEARRLAELYRELVAAEPTGPANEDQEDSD